MISSSVEKIKNLVVDKKAPFVISIDGPCAGGKSTLASKLQEELFCNVVHMDDFYLPFDKRDKNWMNIVAGHMDFDQVINTILQPYKEEGEVCYIPYDCHSDKFMQQVDIDINEILILEGSYSSHPSLEKFVDLKIFVDIDEDLQLERLKKRNPNTYDKFLSMWVPFENNYFKELDIKNKSDLVLSVSN